MLAFLLVTTGCATKPGMIDDLKCLPQDAGLYHGLESNTPLLSIEARAKQFTHFVKKHFAPWEGGCWLPGPKQAFWAVDLFRVRHIFGQNTLPRDPKWIETMAIRSNMETYPTLNRPCIAVNNTSLRALPTHEPVFYDFSKAGEGYPFDYAQNSLVLAGTPLRALHTSKDKAWVLVQSRLAHGWIPVTDMAWVSEEIRRTYNAPAFIAMTQDHVSVVDTKGLYCHMAHIGTVLPLAQRPTQGPFEVLVPLRNAQGEAELTTARISRDHAAIMPFPPTPAMFAQIANAMLNRPYGWGGLYEDRDCSATMLDLLSGFGIYLPRNSRQQYMAGPRTGLKGLGRHAKEQAILKNATPFLTLIRMPGHVMLYIGSHEGKSVVLQSLWGVRTSLFGKSGRHVIGRTVITTLTPGMELWNAASQTANPLDRVSGMRSLTLLPPHP